MKYLIWLGSYSGYGIARQREMLGIYGSAEAVYEASTIEHRAGMEQALRCEEKCFSRGIYVLPTSEFGVRLGQDFPLMLYCRGNDPVSAKRVAIVGTRNVTEYGFHMTDRISSEFTNAGNVIVSGLASGVDSVAHKACLSQGGFTIAVLGGPVDTGYLKRNENLYYDILDKGMVVSEYPPDSPVYPQYFAARDRIIAGLSDITIVTEAGRKSGALITAEYAEKYEKQVYAVPGRLDSEASAGCISLLANNHAKLFSFDFFESDESIPDNLTTEEHKILRLASGPGFLFIPEVAEKLSMTQNQLSSVLFNLEMKGKITVFGDTLCLL